MPSRNDAGRDLVFFLLTLGAVAAAAAYCGKAPFDHGAAVLASRTIRFEHYDGPNGARFNKTVREFDEQVFNVKLENGDDVVVEVKLVRRRRP